MRIKVVNKIILLFLVFGMSIHASGLTYFISESSTSHQIHQKEFSIKKGEFSNFLDLQDNEIELDSEGEKNIDASTFDLFHSSHFVFSELEITVIDFQYLRGDNFSNKLPLYIHFENYRL